jgi:hypothetical protein
MPDQKTSPTTAKSTAPSVKSLSPAGESGDPAVHKLLADLATARHLGDDAGAQAAIKALTDLGVSAA